MNEVCNNCNQQSYWLEDLARGDFVCSGCGAVSETRVIDDTFERRCFPESDSNKSKRAEFVQAYFNSLSSTSIGGNHFNKRQKLNRLQSAHKSISKSTTLTDDHLSRLFHAVSEMASLLSLEKRVVDGAKEILYRYERATLTQKRLTNINGFALAAIHISCGQAQNGQTLESLFMELKQTDYEVDMTDARTCRSTLIKNVPGIDVTTNSKDVITNFCDQLQLTPIVIAIAQKIQTKSQDFVEGKKPTTIAAGSIILACEQLNITCDMESLSAVANITQNTLVKYCRQVKNSVGVLMDYDELVKLKKLYERSN